MIHTIEIKVGLKYRVVGSDDNTRTAPPLCIHLKLDAGKEIGPFQAHFFKIFPRCQADLDFVRMQAAGVEQVNLGFEGFIEKGLEFNFPKPQSHHRSCMQATQ